MTDQTRQLPAPLRPRPPGFPWVLASFLLLLIAFAAANVVLARPGPWGMTLAACGAIASFVSAVPFVLRFLIRVCDWKVADLTRAADLLSERANGWSELRRRLSRIGEAIQHLRGAILDQLRDL